MVILKSAMITTKHRIYGDEMRVFVDSLAIGSIQFLKPELCAAAVALQFNS